MHQLKSEQERRVRTFAPFGIATLMALVTAEWFPTATAGAAVPPLMPEVLLFALLVCFLAFYCPMPAWLSPAISPESPQESTQHYETLPDRTATWVYLSGMLLAPLLAALSQHAADAASRGWSVAVTAWVAVGAVRLGVWLRGDHEMLHTARLRATMVRTRRG